MLDYVETQLTRFLDEHAAEQARDEAINEWADGQRDAMAARLLACRGWLGEQIGDALSDAAINCAQLSLTDPAEAGLKLQAALKKHADSEATGLLKSFAWKFQREHPRSRRPHIDDASLDDIRASSIDLSIWEPAQ